MRDFFKYVLASCVALLLFTGVSIGIVVVLFTAIALSTSEPESKVKAQSMLTLDLSVPIPDTPPASTPQQVINNVLSGQTEPPLSLRTVLEVLEEAAEDDRIVGLYIEGAGAASGLATLREIRSAIEQFKASDKPVIAYETIWNERSYYLVSVADQLMLNPSGLLEFNGFSSEALFFAGALEKYGIGISAIRAGQYKSAVEPFTRTDRSPEEKAQTETLLGALWDEFLGTVATSREMSSDELQAIADRQGLLLPEEALEAGLIDEVVYGDEVLETLHGFTQEESSESSFRQVSIAAYANEIDRDLSGFGSSDPQVAVVYAEGSIVSGEGAPGQIGGDSFARMLREVRLDDEIKAVVLRVNSPGGSAAAADKIAREIQLIQAQKPVIVSMGNLAASGGYLIATHGETIFAAPNTITGSIGVFGLFPNFQGIANQNGVTWDVVKTGEYADIGTVSRPPTESEVAIVQRFIDQVYDDFLQNVADSRPLTRSELEPIAEGRVWSGTNAQTVGLVDEMGGLDEAIASAAAAAELGDDWTVKEYPQPLNFEEEVFRQLFGTRLQSWFPPKETAQDPLTAELNRVKVELETLRSLNDPQGVYTRLPINYWID